MILPTRDEARATSLAHYQRLATLDVGYARWAAQQLAKADPEWHADVAERLDAYLAAQRIRIPPQFEEIPSKLPKLAHGRRGLPERKFFHDTL